MGCPNSKNKSKDLTNGNGHSAANGARTRNDAVRPDEHVPTKHVHDHQDDPLVKGRTDVFIPGETLDENDVVDMFDKRAVAAALKKEFADDTETDNAKNEEKLNEAKLNQSVSEDVKSNNSNGSSNTASAASKQGNILKNSMATSMDKNDNDTSFTSASSTSKSKSKAIDKTLASVFIPNESSDDELETSVEVETSPKLKTQIKDVYLADIDVGHGINEVGMNDQTINEDGKKLTKKSSKKTERKLSKTSSKDESVSESTFEMTTADEYKYSEKSLDSQPAVRYQNKNATQYGLPEGVPKPAPPKSRKNDIITPTTFTVVDKIVDQSPDNAMESLPILASYLSGQTKKSELEKKDPPEEDIGSNLPSPRCATTKKVDILADTHFRKVDENAKNTPESVVLSVEKLARHLCSAAQTDLEKVRAFYYWICYNIRYMYERDTPSKQHMRFDAASTLRQKQGSYVNLMSALCKEAGISVVTIPGCSKGLRHQPDKEFKLAERNHSWNAVYVNGEWRFIDCTWGSGYLDVHGKFQHHFDEFWFFTDPEVFVYDHFPTHPIWQLLEEPIDIDDFNKRPSMTEKSRELGFKLISHREPIVYFQNEVTISFGTENYPLSNITADLRDEDGDEINRHRCICRIDENTFEVKIIPPIAGEYRLILYGKSKDYKHAKFRKLMEYTLRCDEAYPDKVIFPNHIKAWGPEPNYSELCFADSVQNISVLQSESNEMTITLEQTKNVPIAQELKAVTDIENDLKECTMLTALDGCKIIHVRFPSAGYYKLDLYAEGKNEKYEYVGSFLLHCTVSDKPKAFPKYNADSISKHVCEIIEPRDLEIPADSLVTFKLKSNVLRKAMLGIPVEENYGSRLKGIGELTKNGDEFTATIKTPTKGEIVYLSGAAAPPNVFWSRLYEYVTI